MKIESKCKCGASFSVDDPRSVYIQPGGPPDEKGRVYRIEVIYDRWCEEHREHIQSEGTGTLLYDLDCGRFAGV